MGKTLQIFNWPSAEQRQRMVARHQQLMAALTGHDRKVIGLAVMDLLGCYRNALKPGETAKSVAVKYVQELHGLPTWACERACVSIRLGHAPGISLDYPPSTIALRKLVETYVAAAVREANEISEVLRAEKAHEPITPEARQELAHKLAKLADELAAKDAEEVEQLAAHHIAEREQRAREAHRRQIEAEYARIGVDPVETAGMLVTPSLLKSLGRDPRAPRRQPDEEDAA